MKRIFFILLLLLIIFIFSCSKEEEKISTAPVVTAEVITEKPNIEKKEINESIDENVPSARLCHDTDNGIVRWINGTVFGFYDDATRFEFKDYCQDRIYLTEFYCEGESPQQRLFSCRNGCVDDHCV